MTVYTDIIRKYATDTRRAGQLEPADGIGEVGLTSAEAGRKLAVRFTLQLAQDRIMQARYQVFGCGFTIAACAAAAELAEGRPLQDIVSIDAAAIAHRLGGLPEDRGYCADLAAEALQAAVDSVHKKAQTVTTTYAPASSDHGPRITSSDPVYRALTAGPEADGVTRTDRHLFACLLAVADQEPAPIHRALGLTEERLATLLDTLFPLLDRQAVFSDQGLKTAEPPETNPDLLRLLQSYLAPDGDATRELLAESLTAIIAARAAHPGHLWIAMGLFERPQLSMAIGLYLPKLLRANDQSMRWKRFLFKQICEKNGGVMCKSPNCQDCSDYTLCFET